MVGKLYIPKTSDKAVTKLIQISIDKNMTKEEKYITVTFVRYQIVGKNNFDIIPFPDSYGKGEVMNTNF